MKNCGWFMRELRLPRCPITRHFGQVASDAITCFSYASAALQHPKLPAVTAIFRRAQSEYLRHSIRRQ